MNNPMRVGSASQTKISFVHNSPPAGNVLTRSELDAEAAHVGLLIAHEAQYGELAVRVEHVEWKRTKPTEPPQRGRLLFGTCEGNAGINIPPDYLRNLFAATSNHVH